MQEDSVSAQSVIATAAEAHTQRSPDSGLSLRPPTEGGLSASSGDTRAGSRSSTLSSSGDDSVKVKSMGDSIRPLQPPQPQHPHHPPTSAPPASNLVRPSPAMPQPPPTSSTPTLPAVAGLAAQHYAQLSQHYHAAAAMQALSTNPMAAQAAATQLLAAQYQQSLASLTPDMILKQFPHLATASLNAPPHLLGRAPGAPGAAEHLHLMQAREREMAAERERRER